LKPSRISSIGITIPVFTPSARACLQSRSTTPPADAFFSGAALFLFAVVPFFPAAAVRVLELAPFLVLGALLVLAAFFALAAFLVLAAFFARAAFFVLADFFALAAFFTPAAFFGVALRFLVALVDFAFDVFSRFELATTRPRFAAMATE
jgi:hypothetical protein